MATRHLHHDAGGDPAAQGPVPELAAEPPANDTNDFPDVPSGNEADSGTHPPRPPDQPDRNRFAERLGVRRREGSADAGGDGTDRASFAIERATSVLRRGVSSSRALTAEGLSAVAGISARLADRIQPEP